VCRRYCSFAVWPEETSRKHVRGSRRSSGRIAHAIEQDFAARSMQFCFKCAIPGAVAGYPLLRAVAGVADPGLQTALDRLADADLLSLARPDGCPNSTASLQSMSRTAISNESGPTCWLASRLHWKMDTLGSEPFTSKMAKRCLVEVSLTKETWISDLFDLLCAERECGCLAEFVAAGNSRRSGSPSPRLELASRES
jgi:hypothetical protein